MRLLTRSEYARRAGVSPAAITKWCKGAGAAACVGTRIDIDHPAAIEYLKSKGRAPTESLESSKTRDSKPTAHRRATPSKRASGSENAAPAAASELPASSLASGDPLESIGAFEDLTLRELTERFGTATAFKDWLDARKKLVDIREKELKNGELEGTLILRELVKVHVFGAIETSHRRLLTDVAKTITQTIYPMARRGDSADVAEADVRAIISKHLDPVKDTATRVLRDA